MRRSRRVTSGIRVKIAKSFARIHRANLINFGILPLVFQDPADYDLVKQGDQVVFGRVRTLIASGAREIPVTVAGREIVTCWRCRIGSGRSCWQGAR